LIVRCHGEAEAPVFRSFCGAPPPVGGLDLVPEATGSALPDLVPIATDMDLDSGQGMPVTQPYPVLVVSGVFLNMDSTIRHPKTHGEPAVEVGDGLTDFPGTQG
jgi:hypothetical protein